MKIVAFGASTSSKSINKTLASYAASLVEGASVEVLDLNDFELPMFSVDVEAELGQPQAAKDFLAKLAAADAIVVSFAEHNGGYAAAYKSLLDWASRITREIFAHKPVVHLATSPGARGGASVLAAADGSAGFFAADLKGSLSVPKFNEAFDAERGELTDAALKAQLVELVNRLKL